MIFPWMSSYPQEGVADTPEELGPRGTLPWEVPLTRSGRRLKRAIKNRKIDPWEYDEALRAHMQSCALSGYDPSPDLTRAPGTPRLRSDDRHTRNEHP